MENPIYQRIIRSFVLRRGYLSPAQQRAIDQGMPRWCVKFCQQVLNLDEVFGRSGPKILEIGFGMGAATAEIAAAHPENDYLGIEGARAGRGQSVKTDRRAESD